MSEDIKDILNLSGFISDQQKKKKAKKENDNSKKKPEVASREVLSLTGGLFPVQPAPSLNSMHKVDNRQKSSDDRWILYPIVFEESGKPKIEHWTRTSDKDKVFTYQKFNVKADLVKYTAGEYEQHIKDLDSNWTKEETDYLWHLCETFDLRFIVIHDRYDEEYNRTIEDIKDRYYTVARRILESRGETSNALCSFDFDPAYEKERKFHLEKFLMRTKEKNEEEKKLVEEIRKLEAVIKKEEKEQKNLQTIMKIDFKEEEMTGDENEEDKALSQLMQERQQHPFGDPEAQVSFLRSSLMHIPLPISERMNKKLNLVLQELNIPQKPIPTEDNEKLYDRLREKILKMFSLQKHLKRKELEKRRYEEMLEANKNAKMAVEFPKTPVKADDMARTYANPKPV